MLLLTCQKTIRVLKYRWTNCRGHVTTELSEKTEYRRTECLGHVTTELSEDTTCIEV